MNPIRLVSDSTCDLSPELIAKHDIRIVPLFVRFGEESFLDGVDLTPEAMYQEVAKRGILPKTAAASPGMFVEVFEQAVADGCDVVYVGIGSKFSATYQSAVVARDMVDPGRIFLVDSANLSSGSGLLVLKAAKWRLEGLSAQDIVQRLEETIPNVRTQFVINTMDYLHKGGRCSGMQALFGTLLKIKPIIKVVDGAMAVGKKPRGSIQVAVDLLIEEAFELLDLLDLDAVMITHSMADDSARYVRSRLETRIPKETVIETHAGCVISSHCGEGCIGILYILKQAARP
jgi:DegV family protein with EDD domain